MEKVIFTGTHRVRAPEQTLAVITPLLGEAGITRLADVTGLDTLGVPVVMAVRPLAASLSVSQGKGATLPLATVSAAMEAIELWHGEHAVPPPAITGTPARELALGYPVTDLEQPPGCLLTGHTVLDWVEAECVVSGARALVPRAAVGLAGCSQDAWAPGQPGGSSNGLASGNTKSEALIHGLYEVIERDAITAWQGVPVNERTYLDLDSVSGYCAEMIARIRRAGAWLEVAAVPTRFGAACFAACLWHEDFAAIIAAGAGAHSDPAVALSRAVTEAAQSRLTAIAGTRDDLEPRTYISPGGGAARPITPSGGQDWATLTAPFSQSYTTDDAEAAALARRIRAVTGTDPMVAILCAREITVVKVICPGLANSARHNLARPA